MKKKEITKQRKKTIDDLTKEVSELRAKLTATRTNLLGGKESNLKAVRLIRRDIAQNLTIIGELKKNSQAKAEKSEEKDNKDK